MPGNYYVYILASLSRTIYVGVTSDLMRRMYEHRHKRLRGFTAQYNVNRLVYFEHTTDVNAAIAREKQIKKWSRKKKAELIETANAGWVDLAEEWFREPLQTGPPDLGVTRGSQVGRVDFSVGARHSSEGKVWCGASFEMTVRGCAWLPMRPPGPRG
jgi:putative endonuclease